ADKATVRLDQRTPVPLPGAARGGELLELEGMALRGDHAVAVPLGDKLCAFGSGPADAPHVQKEPVGRVLALRHGARDHVRGDAGAASEMLLAGNVVAAIRVQARDGLRFGDVPVAARLGG